jgi:hypothetical protein
MRGKVVTPVSFNLKGAFNGVNKKSLLARLRAKGIPETTRRWIWSFMEDLYTSIGFDDFETDMEPLHRAGLAPGLPLSSVLFAFFNSDLVDQPVDSGRGSSAYIDDYFRWCIGRCVEDNTRTIQESKTRTYRELKHGPGEQDQASQSRRPSSFTSPEGKANSR